MRKPIVFLNVVLLMAAVWLGASVRTAWRANHARYAAVGMGTAEAEEAAAQPVSAAAAGYTEIVARNLFTPDRNNEQPVVQTVQRQRPPLPFVIGTLNLGSGFLALIAEEREASQGTFRRMREGDEIGGYKIAKIAEHQVVLDFDGQKFPIDVYESAASVPRPAGFQAAAPAPPSTGQVVSAVPGAGTTESAAASAPAQATPRNIIRPLPGADPKDPYLSVTIEGNRRKFSRQTPFGIQVWYEEITPGTRPQ